MKFHFHLLVNALWHKTRIAKLNLTPGTQLKKKQGLAQPRSRVKNYRQLDSLFFSYSINISEEVKKKCKILSDQTIKRQVLSRTVMAATSEDLT